MMHPEEKTISIDSAEPLVYDKRLAHAINFKFLPPITKSGRVYGIYRNLEQQGYDSFEKLTDEIGKLPTRSGADQSSQYVYRNNINDKRNPQTIQSLQADVRKSSKFQRLSIDIRNTSVENNMIGQFFEVKRFGNNKKLVKLDVIDRGIMRDDSDLNYPNKHVFFVGKVMTDNYGVNSFLNLFTLVFD